MHFCDGCEHFSQIEATAKNMPDRIMAVCFHGEENKIIRVRRKIGDKPPVADKDMMAELKAMIDMIPDIEDDMKGWVRQETKKHWPAAWHRLKRRIENMTPRPKWCEKGEI